MLCEVIHALLLLPVGTMRPMLHDLLSLLPQMDRLNRLLPAHTVLEQEEFDSVSPSGTDEHANYYSSYYNMFRFLFIAFSFHIEV